MVAKQTISMRILENLRKILRWFQSHLQISQPYLHSSIQQRILSKKNTVRIIEATQRPTKRARTAAKWAWHCEVQQRKKRGKDVVCGKSIDLGKFHRDLKPVGWEFPQMVVVFSKGSVPKIPFFFRFRNYSNLPRSNWCCFNNWNTWKNWVEVTLQYCSKNESLEKAAPNFKTYLQYGEQPCIDVPFLLLYSNKFHCRRAYAMFRHSMSTKLRLRLM